MYPWINSYVFCKNLVERAIRKHRGHIKTVIVRPPATTACVNEPMPGWVDSLSAGGITAFPMALGMRRHFFMGEGNIWTIPGDVVSNGIIAAVAYCDALPNDDTSVVTTCLSSVHPILWTKWIEAGGPYLAYNPTHTQIMDPGATGYDNA